MASLEIDHSSGKRHWNVDYPPLIASRYTFSATYFRGEIFITSQSNAYSSEIGTTERFDLKTKSWTRLQSKYAGQDQLSAHSIQSFKSKLYVSGGFDLCDVEGEEYDSSTVNLTVSHVTYELVESIASTSDRSSACWEPIAVSLNQPRGSHASVVYQGRLLVGGGTNFRSLSDGAVFDMREEGLNTVEAFDGDRWILLEAKMNRFRGGNSLKFFVFQSELYVAGEEYNTSIFSIEKMNKAETWEIGIYEKVSFLFASII
jgi:hypothetical protein